MTREDLGEESWGATSWSEELHADCFHLGCVACEMLTGSLMEERFHARSFFSHSELVKVSKRKLLLFDPVVTFGP